MTTLAQVTQQARQLSPVEQLQLVEAVLQGLEPIDPEVEKKWAIEAEARIDAFERGELKAEDWDEIERDLRNELH